MASDNIGVQAFIRQSAPLALYTHCRSHFLNLSIAAACKIQEVRNMTDALNSLFLFFDLSSKCQRFLELVLETKAASTRKRQLVGLCKTRWVERHTCFETISGIYEYIIICLVALTSTHKYPELALVNPNNPTSEHWDWHRDRETKITAQGILAVLQKSEFLIEFIVVKNCLHLLKGVTVKLQKWDIDIHSAYEMVEGTRNNIEALTMNIEKEHDKWFQEAQEMAKLSGNEISMPRIVGRQQGRANTQAPTSAAYYRINYSTQFPDHLLHEDSVQKI